MAIHYWPAPCDGVQITAVPRPARLEDAEAIARIYNEGIEDRIATFETELRTTSDIERILDERMGRYPRAYFGMPDTTFQVPSVRCKW